MVGPFMPLYPGALELIRANLEAIELGKKVEIVTIGTLTDTQLADINANRATLPYRAPPIIAEIKFMGRHLHKSRIAQDGYAIEDVLEQISSALSESSAFIHTRKATVIQNHMSRIDRYGNVVQDQAVLECTARHPWPELFSVIPKGDKPPKAKGR